MEKIGFIGLGIMGKPMARQLLKAGYPLLILKTSAAATALKNEGATLVDTARACAAGADVVITMLPDSPELESVFGGDDGILAGLRKDTLFIDMSTVAPATARDIFRRCAERGVEALDAPVSGGQAGAEAGTLSIMAGGTAAAFKRAQPVFEKMGKNIVHIGETGAGQVTKACNQIIVGATIQAVAEAFVLADKSGVDLVKLRAALLGGFAQSRILDIHGQRIIDRNFKPGFKSRLHRKDMNIALQAAREQAVPLPASALVASQLDAVLARGNGELDHSALALLLESMAGVRKD